MPGGGARSRRGSGPPAMEPGRGAAAPAAERGTPRTPLELARIAADVLASKGIEQPRLEAELLLAAVLGVRRLDLYLQHDRPLLESEVAAYREAVRRRMRREPLQYITGEVGFRELTLRVDRRVLIPRPETEVLVGAVLEWAGEDSGIALDVGTGSGAIALSLAREGPFRRVVATDVSRGALEVARENARRAGLETRVEFREGSLWEAVRPGEAFDVIVSNPPYVAEADRASLPPEVRDYEPPEALFAPRGGLGLLEALVAGAPARLRPGGLLALEVGDGQAPAVLDAIHATGAYERAWVVRDLAGRDRVVLATTSRLPLTPEE